LRAVIPELGCINGLLSRFDWLRRAPAQVANGWLCIANAEEFVDAAGFNAGEHALFYGNAWRGGECRYAEA